MKCTLIVHFPFFLNTENNLLGKLGKSLQTVLNSCFFSFYWRTLNHRALNKGRITVTTKTYPCELLNVFLVNMLNLLKPKRKKYI